MSANSIKRKIDSFVRQDGRLNERLHTIMLEIMEHSQQHKECSLFEYLLNNLNQGRRKGAIIEWIRKYSPVTLVASKTDKDALVAKFTVKPKNWTDETWAIEQANATPYWKKEDTELKQVLADVASIKRGVFALIKRTESKIEAGEADQSQVVEMKSLMHTLSQAVA